MLLALGQHEDWELSWPLPLFSLVFLTTRDVEQAEHLRRVTAEGRTWPGSGRKESEAVEAERRWPKQSLAFPAHFMGQ